MKKFKLYLNKDKETKWLNEMSADGYALTKFFAGVYTFEKCTPGQYIYQVDFTSGFYKVSDDYREFMEEMDAEIITLWEFWVILRKKAADGPFELYTDTDSQIEHYKKILIMLKIVTIFEILCFTYEAMAACLTTSVIEIVPLVCMAILALMIIGLLRAVMHTKQKINELLEQKGEQPKPIRSRPDKLLLSGLFINMCALIARDSVSGSIVNIVQILAIVLMLAGLYRSCRR